MYNLVIIDDEKNIIEGLKRIINWKQLNCKIIGSAKNGREGLALIQETSPDIAIIDINMPDFDGLTLISEIKKHVQTQCIILSGYSDFEYAQKGIQLNVLDYLLKPVEEEELISAVKKAQKKIELARLAQEQIINLKSSVHEIYKKNRVYVLKEFVSSIHENETSARSILEENNIKFDFTNYYVIAFQLKPEKTSPYFDSDTDNYFKKHFSPNSLIFEYSETELLVLYPVQSPLTSDFLYSKLRQAMAGIENDFIGSISCGVSQIRQNLFEVSFAFAEAHFLAIYSTATANTNIALYSDTKNIIPQNSQSLSIDLINELEKNIMFLNYKDLRDNVDKMFQHIINTSEYKMIDLQIYSTHLITECMKKLYELGIQYAEETTELFIQLTNLDESKTASNYLTLTTEFINSFEKTVNKFQKNSQPFNKNNIELIKKYILENINSDLSLESVSKAFFISPVYLSQLFKKDNNKGYFEFVQTAKFEKACELLKFSHMKIYEISNHLGYKDSKHFSKVFESKFGCTPSIYRKKSNT